MITFIAFLCFCCLPLTNSLTYIDNAFTESNPKYMNMTIVYTHNEKGSSVSNITFETKETIVKMLAYVKVNIAADQAAINYKRELLKTVIDVNKLFKGSQVNFFIAAFIKSIHRFMDFEMKFPIKPGTYRFINVLTNSSAVPLLQNTPGSLDFRMVGKVQGNSATQFFARLAITGGYRRPW